jgi:predicted HTH transcriptional regulator
VIDDAIARAIASQDLFQQNDLLVAGLAYERSPISSPPIEALRTLIAGGESERVEFKQTLRWDVETQTLNRKLEDIVIKTVAGFANQAGGVLLIGVRDDGTITGIEPDYSTLNGGNRDKFELHLTHLINVTFGAAFHATRLRLSFPIVAGITICRVDVQRSPTGIVVKIPDRNGNAVERFYVRIGNSTQELSPSQMAAFIANHGKLAGR